MPSPVALLKAEHDELLVRFLQDEPSLAISISATLVKALLLAGASELEVEFQLHLRDYFTEVTKGTSPAVEFVTKKGINRQFHTYFNWDNPNVNSFFALFGPEFKAAMTVRLRTDEALTTGIRDFLSLGARRNEVVHKNFAAFSLTMTAEEVFHLYKSAKTFCDALPELLRVDVTAVQT